jgi:uncharacterized protein YbbK (DUF523 family)
VQKVLVSACLLGASVRYHGGDARSSDPILQQWADEGRVVSVCPEVAGGLPVPRPAAEIALPVPGEADEASRPLRVVTRDGRDVTGPFVVGADHAVDLARREGIRTAILKDGSPSCGSTVVYDGSFTGNRVPGRGVTAAALEAAGIRVFNETQIPAAAAWLAGCDDAPDATRREVE